MKKQTHGGAREGAGRPSHGIETKIISFRVPAKHAAKLKALMLDLIKKYLNEIPAKRRRP